MGTSVPSAAATRFVVRAVAGSLAAFGVLRLPWVEAHVLLPLTRLQAEAAVRLVGAPSAPVEATLACSGADALALFLGAVVAYPAAGPARLAGAAGAAALMLGLNTVRIGSLGLAAASPDWFAALHLYVWPAAITASIGGYMFVWTRVVDRRAGEEDRPPAAGASGVETRHRTRRFLVLAGALLAVFLGASPLYLDSTALLALAGGTAAAAAAALGVLGISAQASGAVLWTPHGGFRVTQECLATPLVPVYVAAICTCGTSRRRMAVGLLATPPLFAALGVARLLVVALPVAAASSLFLVHAFYQLAVAAVLVWLAAQWRHRPGAVPAHAAAGVAVGAVVTGLLALLVSRAMAGTATPQADPQGALAFLPPFQVGLYLALAVAARGAATVRQVLAGLAVLGLTQLALLLALQVVPLHAALVAHTPSVRAWAVAVPALIFAAVIHGGRAPR